MAPDMTREDAIDEAVRRTIPATLSILRARRYDAAWSEAQIAASARALADQIRDTFRRLVDEETH
jgi:hypothetical protein